MNNAKDILDIVNDSTNIRNTLEMLDDVMGILTDDTVTVAGLTIAGVIISIIAMQA